MLSISSESFCLKCSQFINFFFTPIHYFSFKIKKKQGNSNVLHLYIAFHLERSLRLF